MWLIVLVVAACGASGPSASAPAPAQTIPARPAVPAGWTSVASGAGDLRLVLPPDIESFETSGPIFANQPPPSTGGEWIQLLAEGPRTVELQPGEGESLDQWLERRWLAGEPLRGETTIRSVLLPAGEAVELRTTLEPGTAHERAVILFAIRSPAGVAFLAIDGPPDQMDARAADLALIPMLLEIPR